MKRTLPIEQADLAYARQLLRGASSELRELAFDWYPSVHERTKLWALETGYSHDQVVTVLALYSINQGWQGNITLTKRAVYEGVYSGLGMVRERVARVLAGDDIASCLTSRPKVPSFRTRILYGYGVPIDRHMAVVFGKTRQGDAERYCDYCVACTRYLALEQGMTAEDMQPLLWLLRILDTGKALRYYLPNVA